MSNGIGLTNGKLSYEDNLEILRDNGIEVSKKLLNMGATLLKAKLSRVQQNVTSTSYTPLTEWQVGIKTSGGLVLVYLETSTYVDTQGSGTIQLLIDNDPKKESRSGGNTVGVDVMQPFMWMGELVKGTHTLKFKAKVGSGQVNFGSTTHDSALYVVEFNNGG